LIEANFRYPVIVHYWLLSFALVLLWFPRPWFRFGAKVVSLSSRKPVDKNLRDSNDASLQLMDELPNPRNWVDLFRALAGGIAVMMFCFERVRGAPKGTAEIIFIIQCAILVIALFVQTTRNFQQRVTLVAPIFFIFGLSFGLIGWQAALFACVTIWVVNLLLPSAGIFLMVFAVLEVVFAKLLARGFHAHTRTLILAAMLTFIPVLLSAMMNRRLVKLNKKTRVRSAKA
jgi:membrane-associated HD superfamily phosphohydrolase